MKVSDHVIVCGYDGVGKNTVEELLMIGKKVMVVAPELTAEEMEYLSEHLVGVVSGDPTEETCLKRAFIDSADTIIAALPQVGNNVFIALTARDLNPDIRIIARSDQYSESTKRKFMRTGAERVVSPYVIGGYILARAATRPYSAEFLNDALTSTYGIEINEVQVPEDGIVAGKKLDELDIKGKTGALVVAVKLPGDDMDKTFLKNPPPDTKLVPGSWVVAIGWPKELKLLKRLIDALE